MHAPELTRIPRNHQAMDGAESGNAKNEFGIYGGCSRYPPRTLAIFAEAAAEAKEAPAASSSSLRFMPR